MQAVPRMTNLFKEFLLKIIVSSQEVAKGGLVQTQLSPVTLAWICAKPTRKSN